MKNKLQIEELVTAEGKAQYVYTICSFRGGFMPDESYKMRSRAYMSQETAHEAIKDFVKNYSGTTENDWYIEGYRLCKNII